jgi:hypothetical protein
MQAYRAALELYDLRMAYMLIAASQRDPAEHLEELEMLAAVEDPHMHRFAIDRKLRRHRIALGHVVAAGRSHAEEAREFAVKHGLMKELLGLLKGHTEERMAALDAYAQACPAVELSCLIGREVPELMTAQRLRPCMTVVMSRRMLVQNVRLRNRCSTMLECQKRSTHQPFARLEKSCGFCSKQAFTEELPAGTGGVRQAFGRCRGVPRVREPEEGDAVL